MHWVRLVHFSINKACALKAKMFAYGLLLIVLLKLLFSSEGTCEIHVIAVKIEPPFESKQKEK